MQPFENALPIWHPDGSFVNQTIEFSSRFDVSDAKDVRCFVHVSSAYVLYINDTYAASGGFPDYPDWRIYDEIDLDPYVRPGENSFRLTAYWQGEDSFLYRTYPAEAVFALFEKEEELLVSGPGFPVRLDTRWKEKVPYVSTQIGFSFEYTARPLADDPVPAVQAPGYEQGAGDLYPRPNKRLTVDPPCPAKVCAAGRFLESPENVSKSCGQRMQLAWRQLEKPVPAPALPSQEGIRLDANDWIIDLGRELVGYLLLDISVPEDCQVRVGWGEQLDDMHVRERIDDREFASCLHLPKGRTVFYYPLKRMGMRYLELHIDAPSAILYYAGMTPVFYPLEQIHEFTCADNLHEQIFRTGVRTLQACMHDHYEDCPWREQSLYTMDSRNQMLCGYLAFDEYRFAASSLQVIAKSLRSDHLLELIAPGRFYRTIPCYSAIYLVQVAEYFKYSDDFMTVKGLLDVCRDIADGFIARIDPTGLIPRFVSPAYWNYYEWEPGLSGDHPCTEENTYYDAPLQCFVIMGLTSLSSLEMSLGSQLKAASYLESAHKLAQNVHQIFYDPQRGCYASFYEPKVPKIYHYCELTQALAVESGLVPDTVLDTVLKSLAAGTITAKNTAPANRFAASLAENTDRELVPISLSHSIFKFEALLKRPDAYARLVFDTIARDFGFMLRNGATTFWETIQGADDFDKAGSLCHGWSAVPVYLYLKYCVDIRKEGTLISPSLTGIKDPGTRLIKDPGRRIQNAY